MGMAGGQNGSELMILMAMMTLILWILIKIENLYGKMMGKASLKAAGVINYRIFSFKTAVYL